MFYFSSQLEKNDFVVFAIYEYLSAHPFLSLGIDPVQEQMAIGSADGKVITCNTTV